jgi:hypothetical protein
MKKSHSCSLVASILLLFPIGVTAQTTDTKLDQVELLKQFVGTWKYEVGKDTIVIQTVTFFGKAIEDNIITVTNGKILSSSKEVWGYDKKTDKYIAASIRKSSTEIALYAAWFTSNSLLKIVRYQDISDPEKASYRVEWNLKTPDLTERTVYRNNQVTNVSTYTREKQ